MDSEEFQGLSDSGSGDGLLAKEVLSFRAIGRPVNPDCLVAVFQEMSDAFGKDLRCDAVARVAKLSGTHILKLVSPRADSEQNVIRVGLDSPFHLPGRRVNFIPSPNAADTKVAKILFRPIEVFGSPSRSIVDHVLDPDAVSHAILAAFGMVFGSDRLAVLRDAVLAPAAHISVLPAAEFPIIYLPNPAGGDIQATPVSPAAAYMGFREVEAPYFVKQEKNAPKVPRGSWSRQVFSAQLQNVSAAIGGKRKRFHAKFPRVLNRFEADVLRFASGGAFPRMHGADSDVPEIAMRYADLVVRNEDYSNKDIRDAIDRLANVLIGIARDFVAEVFEEAVRVKPGVRGVTAPSFGSILLGVRWRNKDQRDRARAAFLGDHFRLAVDAAEKRA